MRAASVLKSVAIGLGFLACVSPTDPLGRNESLQFAQKRYTEHVRWGNLDQAAAYVDPKLRDDFLALRSRFERIRITDFETGTVESRDHDTAEVEVTYRGYALPYYVEKSVRERQTWYRDAGLDNAWHVRPQLALLVDTLEPGQP